MQKRFFFSQFISSFQLLGLALVSLLERGWERKEKDHLHMYCLWPTPCNLKISSVYYNECSFWFAVARKAWIVYWHQGGREAKLETGFLFGCVLYRMICSVQFLPRRSMWFYTAFAILDTDPRTKLEWGISSPFLPDWHTAYRLTRSK